MEPVKSEHDEIETMPEKGYASISIPRALKNEIEKLFTDLEKAGIGLGYSSITEFTKEAIRRLMSETRKEYLNRKR